MKKLVLFSAVIVAVAFSSCKKTTEAPVEETVTVETITVDEIPVVLEGDSTVVIEVETIEVAE